MNRLRRKLAVNGVATILSVIFILSMIAAPVVAKAVDSITSAHIRDGTITNVDIAGDAAIAASKINRAGLDADTLDGSDSADFSSSDHDHNAAYVNDNAGEVGSADLEDGSVDGAKIADGTIADDHISGSAAISDSKIGYSKKTRVLSVSSQNFTPRVNSWDYGKDWDDLYLRSGSGGFLSAPVNLPHGAVVTGFKFEALDNVDDTITVELRAWDMANARVTNLKMSAVETTGAAASWRTFTETDPIALNPIDNNTRAYFIWTLIGDASEELVLGRVVITYQVTGP